MVIFDHISRMVCDVDGDNLLGEDLKEMESNDVGLASHDSTKGHKHKRHSSSQSGARAGVRIGARAGATLGVQNKKAAFLRRGSPMKRQVSSSVFPSYLENKLKRHKQQEFEQSHYLFCHG